MECAGCKQPITSRRFLTCSLCKEPYDLECANIPELRFYNTMDAHNERVNGNVKRVNAKNLNKITQIPQLDSIMRKTSQTTI